MPEWPCKDKIFYEAPEGVIYCGDNRDILPYLPKVDLVLTDPPYFAKNIGVNEKVYDSINMPNSEFEYNQFCQEWFSLILKNCERIIFTPGTKSIWKYPPAKWMLCWHKPGAVNYNAFGGFNIWEPVLVYGSMGKGRHFVEDFISSTPRNFEYGPHKEHPCPKNINLWNWLMQNGSASNETVLDPFLGSGTTAVCAKKLNRKFIGIEISEKYCQIAVERLRQSVMRLE
jgi:DNA modification methylase